MRGLDRKIVVSSFEVDMAYIVRGIRKASPILVLSALLVVLFWEWFLSGKILVPADLLGKELPWSLYVSQPVSLQNHWLSDVIAEVYPNRIFISKMLKEFQIACWNPYIGGGVPAIATANIFIPSSLWYFFSDVPTANNLSLFFRLLAAGIFMYLFLRQIGAGRFGSLVAGMAFMLNGKFMVSLPFIQPAVYLWLPLILLLLEKVYVTRNITYGVLAGFPIGLAFLNGSIQHAAITVFAIGLYLLVRVTLRRNELGEEPLGLITQNVLMTCVALLIGFALSAIYMIPHLELFFNSPRRPGVSSFNIVNQLGTVPFLLSFVWPNAVGNQHSLSVLKIIGTNPDGFQGYIGILPFAFAVVAVIYRRCKHTRIFFWFAVTILGLLILTPLKNILYYKALPVYICAASVLSGLGADYVLRMGHRADIGKLIKYLKYILICVVLALIIVNITLYFGKDTFVNAGKEFVIGHLSNNQLYATDPDFYLSRVEKTIDHYSLLSPTMYFPVLVGICSYIVLLLWSKRKLGVRVFQTGVCAIIAVDLLYFGMGYLPMVERSTIFPDTASTEFLKSDQSVFRVKSFVGNWIENPPVFRPNTLLPYGIQSYDIYHSLPPLRSNIFSDEELLDISNVKYVAAAPEISLPKSKYDLAFDKDVRIYRNKGVMERVFVVPHVKVINSKDRETAKKEVEGLDLHKVVILDQEPEFSLPNSNSITGSIARIIKYSPDEVKINANMTGSGVLILGDNYYPGWKVFVDGKEEKLLKANFFLRGVFLKQGVHDVKFVYEPMSFKVGLIISSFTLVAIMLLVCVKTYRRSMK